MNLAYILDPDNQLPILFHVAISIDRLLHKITKIHPLPKWPEYSGDLNIGLLWNLNGRKQSDRQMVCYSNHDLNSRLNCPLRRCCLNIRLLSDIWIVDNLSIIQMPNKIYWAGCLLLWSPITKSLFWISTVMNMLPMIQKLDMSNIQIPFVFFHQSHSKRQIILSFNLSYDVSLM